MKDREGSAEPTPVRFSARSRPDAQKAPPKLDVTPQLLADLDELAVDATTIVAGGRERFLDADSGRLARHAADSVIIKVQEICDPLPDQVRARHPEIPWSAIRGVRNRLGHNYRGTDYRIVWNGIAADVPALAEALREEPPGALNAR